MFNLIIGTSFPGHKRDTDSLFRPGTAADYQQVKGVKTMNSNRLTPTNQ